MQMLKKIFNSDRKYYLELDESSNSNPVKQAVKAKDAVQEKIKESQPVKQVVETVQEVVDVAQDKLEANVATDNNSAAPAKAKAKNKTNSASSKQATSTKATATPKNSGASSYDPPFWVAAMYNNNGSATTNSDGTKAEQTFATDNLMPTVTKSRRRPGPSLNKFKAMASKAKTPKG